MHLPSILSLALSAALTKLAVGSLMVHARGKLDERSFANFGEKISQFHHQLLQQSADFQKVSSAKVVIISRGLRGMHSIAGSVKLSDTLIECSPHGCM